MTNEESNVPVSNEQSQPELKLEELSLDQVSEALEVVNEEVKLEETPLKNVNIKLMMAQLNKSNSNWKRMFMHGVKSKPKPRKFWHMGELISEDEHAKLSIEERLAGSRFDKKHNKGE